MASAAFDTFTCFPYLPAELQKQVWEQAAADLPTLDIQRFTAEIAESEHRLDSDGDPSPMLCFTPHADFIMLTTGYRGLMGACKESRKAAQPQISRLVALPICYVTTSASGTVLTKKGVVPFNPAGYFCVSGFYAAVKMAKIPIGARGSHLACDYTDSDEVFFIDEGTSSPIKNLMIALDRAARYDRVHKPMRGWDPAYLEITLESMKSLEKVSLIGEGIINRRHKIDSRDFNRLLQTSGVMADNYVDWHRLWKKLNLRQNQFYANTRASIDSLNRSLLLNTVSQANDLWHPDDVAEFTAEMTELKRTLSIINE